MKKELKGKQFIVYTGIYLIMVYTLAVVLGELLSVNLNLPSQFMITLLVGLIVQLFVLFPASLLGSIFVGIVAVFLYYQYKPEIVIRIGQWLIQFMGNIISHLRGMEEIFIENSRMFWIVIIILLSLYTVIILFKTKHIYLLLPVYFLSFLYYWYIFIDIAYSMMRLFALTFLILMGLEGYFSARRQGYKENDSTNFLNSPWVKVALSYSLIIIVIAGIMPKGGKLIDWYWLEGTVQNHFPFVIDLRDDIVYSRSFGQSELFDFRQTGFQTGDTRLGGPVRLNERIVMEVKAPYPLYLRGNVKSTYRDSYWEASSKSQVTYDLQQLLPMEVSSGNLITLEITYKNMATSTVFAPYQPVRIISDGIDYALVDSNYQMSFYGAKYKEESYKIHAAIPTKESLGNLGSINRRELQEYLQIPRSLSSKISSLALDITKNANNPYESAIALQNYLRENYTYSLEPSPVPEGREFVEYFLFEEKQGYCTYFATSLAMLLRTVGIPARYVEGYLMPTEQEDGIYQVRQSNAHAWVEAYVGSGGWITLEATPAFESPVLMEVEALPTNGPNRSTTSPYDDFNELLERALGSNEEDNIRQPVVEIERSLEDLQIPTLENSLTSLGVAFKKILRWLIQIMILGIIPLRAYYIHLKIKRYLKGLDTLKHNDKIVCLYQNILQMMGVMNYPIHLGETPSEYAVRINYRIYDTHYNFKSLTALYIKAKYSQEESTLEEAQEINQFMIYMDKKLHQQLGLWKYMFLKYIKGDLIQCYKATQ